MDAKQALQRIVENYLRSESSMRWGATPGQIRAAAKQMIEARRIPAPLAKQIREHIDALRESEASRVL